jgi:hypothetical protein
MAQHRMRPLLAATWLALSALASASCGDPEPGRRCIDGTDSFFCARGLYCLADERYGCNSDFWGTCQLRPRSCPNVDEPVCGCGGAEAPPRPGYGDRFRNECEARRAGYHWPVAPCVNDE